MIRGINHVTLAVADLEHALAFYGDVLGLRLAARWPAGAYLEAGSLWLCLSLNETHRTPRTDDTHLAFDVAAADFATLVARIAAVAPQWRENRSEGASLYFLDPDGHKLELHVGSLETRLADYRARNLPGMLLLR